MTRVIFTIGGVYNFNSMKEANDYREVLGQTENLDDIPEVTQMYLELSDEKGEMELLRYIDPEEFNRRTMAKLEYLMKANADVLKRLKEA